ncbi:hypothetical protein [Mangrovihabitans endophyticus]|uniref:IPTL-CTERM protein sorting domain-containing protein n=1 Tax=Mangrovihabitans endophyticus TaxID=1751298 RepID=A0A8J3C6F4_9ACTN|nr:hypothetical protein [Mangrovihabitans endophyticus]GGL15077.1 hypothetical protein GCM10012284_57190 [Mangrovihabitans endophyticus]
MSRRSLRTTRRLVAPGLAAAVFAVALFGTAAPAHADTANATATAVELSLLGGSVVTTGQAVASNTGSGTDDEVSQTPALTVLGSQSVINAGVAVQRAVARSDGTSAACAGLIGSGGSIQIGADGSCQLTLGNSNGVRVTLVTGTQIKADALIASCTASSDGIVTTHVDVVGAKVYALGLPIMSLDAEPTPETWTSIAGVAMIGDHLLTHPGGPGSVRNDALSIDLLTGTVSSTIGKVTCGPNAVTVPTPAIPAEGMAMLAGIVGVTGIGWWLRKRRLAA